MAHSWKNTIRFLVCLFLLGCQSKQESVYKEGFVFQGETQGTTYQLIIAEEEANFTQLEIENLLNKEFYKKGRA